MNLALANRACVVALAFLMTVGVIPQVAKAKTANTKGITRTQLMLGDVGGNVAFLNSSKLTNVLESYINSAAGGTPCDPVTGPPTLGKLIKKIRDCNVKAGVNPERLPGLRGLGGGLGLLLLDRAQNALVGGPLSDFNPAARVHVTMDGKITDYSFTESFAGSNMGNGITTYVTWRVVTSGAGTPPPKTDSYRWVIEVTGNAFRVEAHNTDADPFPASGIAFSQDMLNRIKELGFTFKLWAKGTDIVIKQLWHKLSHMTSEEQIAGTVKPDGTPFTALPKYDRLDDPDPESCIDMFFAVPTSSDVPKTWMDLSALGGPPFWCLGRCANPMIINTR